jgi:protein-S-isoprenylcysteine O-methyltransferase Ste14
MWAAGYIGVAARKTSCVTQVRITSGPYKLLQHPLYIGNFLIVSGVTILYNPPVVYALIVILMFIMIYGVIIAREQAYISQLIKKQVTFHVTKCVGELSTIIVIIITLLIHMIAPKNIVFNS